MKQVVWFLVFLLLVSLVSATDYPSYRSYVSDYADVIEPEYESRINNLCEQIEKETTVQIAVLTIDDLQDVDEYTYAVEVFKEWGIGKKDVDNGLLILVKPKRSQDDFGAWKIEVGYGLEPVITDAMAGRIGRDTMLPYFEKDEYGQGIYAAVVDITGFIEGKEEVVSKYTGFQADVENDFDYFYAAFFIALIIGGIVGLATKKVKNKKAKWGIKIGVGLLIGIGLFIFWSYIIAIIFFVLYLFTSGGRGGFFFFPFGGRGRGGGGFGGFGGGLSGGGGAGGRW